MNLQANKDGCLVMLAVVVVGIWAVVFIVMSSVKL
jgi:hypothetical protein